MSRPIEAPIELRTLSIVPVNGRVETWFKTGITGNFEVVTHALEEIDPYAVEIPLRSSLDHAVPKARFRKLNYRRSQVGLQARLSGVKSGRSSGFLELSVVQKRGGRCYAVPNTQPEDETPGKFTKYIPIKKGHGALKLIRKPEIFGMACKSPPSIEDSLDSVGITPKIKVDAPWKELKIELEAEDGPIGATYGFTVGDRGGFTIRDLVGGSRRW